MRDILFKGKRLDNGDIISGDLITHEGAWYGDIKIPPKTKYYILERQGCSYNVLSIANFKYIPEHNYAEIDPDSLQESTGFRDTQGTLLFTEDVVVDSDNNKYRICWYMCSFVLNLLDDEGKKTFELYTFASEEKPPELLYTKIKEVGE